MACSSVTMVRAIFPRSCEKVGEGAGERYEIIKAND
jgi:hypothetical protein